MNTYLDGSVSHGTLKTADLLAAFADVLESMTLLHGHVLCNPERFSDRDRYNDLIWDARECARPGSDEADELLQELIDTLNEFAPEGYYFGAHGGNGSDFGFWSAE